ncbi:MAG: DoxX family protein [Tepidiformaceae bacterium]
MQLTTTSTSASGPSMRRVRRNAVLWTVQVLLTALFLFAGVSKLVATDSALADLYDLPTAFMRFVGVCEVLGGAGLVLPGVLRRASWLTPLASAGLVGIMISATIVTVVTASIAAALAPFAVGVVAASVAYARLAEVGRDRG